MSYPFERYQLGLGGRLTPGVKWLLIANASAYLFQQIIQSEVLLPGTGLPIPWETYWFGLNFQQVINNFAIWQFASYMFLHGGFFHLFFNMFILWIFGSEVERQWGTREFTKYYFITGIGAGVVSLIFSFGTNFFIIGASGAVYGVILAFAMMFPDRVITLLILFVLPVSMKAKHLAMGMAVISIFGGITNLFGTNDGIAHFAHLGGLVAGYFYLKSDWKIDTYLGRILRKRKPGAPKMEIHRYEKNEYLQKQVDEILDKINEIGYENLTQAEKDILKQASDHLSKRSDSD